MPFSLATLPHRLHRWLGLDRRRGARDRAVTLDRSRIFILPTAQGLLFAALTFLMLLGAANYNNSLAFLLTFLLMGLGLIALLHTYRNLAGLTLRPGRCAPVFCGEPARYEFAVEAGGGRRCALALQFAGESPVWFDLDRGGATVALTAATTRRGWRPAGRLSLHTRYPLGLFRAWAYLNFEQACLVYPRPADHLSAPSPRTGEGGGRLRAQSGGDDFLGHRDHVPGDPPRHVDWKAAARSGRLLSKRFGDHEQVECWLDWDEHAGLDAETRLARLCRGVLAAEAQGLRYGLRLPGTALAPALGETHRHQCLRALALFEAPA